jgi:hypothetical protein
MTRLARHENRCYSLTQEKGVDIDERLSTGWPGLPSIISNLRARVGVFR